MIRPFHVIAGLRCLSLPVIATEWQDLKAQYETCILVAGLGAGNGLNDPNEWNNAEGLPATSAELSEPHSAMADIHGRIFVADKNAHAIRRIDPDGTIHTVAGMNLNELPGASRNAGFNGDGPARQRLLNGPQHARVMPDGTFYILDSENRRIRRVDNAGMMVTAGKLVSYRAFRQPGTRWLEQHQSPVLRRHPHRIHRHDSAWECESLLPAERPPRLAQLDPGRGNSSIARHAGRLCWCIHSLRRR